uniref:Uncharacterized protein n=1 Tax=Chromera velia CCMP2878 TaxID=1169474 RepID=A0A0G4I9R4_9ALVE|eukprot:Cvel_12220.t1-p1 / transcript=Cvel_12220.t1 / gene=Cvel_12220 / organism=Chromera_velia_CCMP2878 / gene_product=hypothetical protein / transcript_product=hypothetical protein / location=Cvel_scaffold791:332-1746(-) / protein_length=139 / sequence_SO=supercontig / SO=protein_coding / is_pseudo=false
MAKKELPFCGFMRISVQDNDGLEKRLKGCIMEAPLHKKVEGDNVVLFADLPKEDPIRFLQITSDENDHLACLWWFGSGKRETHERYPCDKLLAIMNTVKTKPVVDKLEDAVSSFTARACMPYIPDGYNRLVEVRSAYVA